jgi:hypothetical protein
VEVVDHGLPGEERSNGDDVVRMLRHARP